MTRDEFHHEGIEIVGSELLAAKNRKSEDRRLTPIPKALQPRQARLFRFVTLCGRLSVLGAL